MSEVFDITDLPATVNHTIYQGDTYSHLVEIKEDGLLVDIDNDDFSLYAVDKRGNEAIDLAIGTGITVVDTGQVEWGLTNTETQALPTNCEIKYHFRWTKADGTVKTLTVGTIKVVASI